MSPNLKKFLVTAVLAALIVGFGVVVAIGPGPAEQQAASQAITEAARPKLPSSDETTADSAVTADQSAAAAAAAPADGTAAAAAPAAQAETPAVAAAAPQALTGLTARVPDGMTAATGLSSVGSLDPAVAPVRIQFAATGAGISEIVFADFWNTADDRRAARDARKSGDAAQMPADGARFVLATSTRIG